ncbi:MAG TPA: LacI family DNA-binding transcriptional regulator [Actinomycetes bacterium]|nr:LacI family DNA-binding transcriptional regulator [Actinomycetes bacterium]
MSKRATIAEVAELASVHKATVARALNPDTAHRVSAETAKRIQCAAEQLGYIPNIVARGLRKSLSMTIGVVVRDLENPIFPPIVRGIESHLSARGYTALIANTDCCDVLERAAFDSLLQRRVDGFVMATGLADHPLLAQAFERGIRVVVVNPGIDAVPCPLVTGADADGMAAAVEHLLGLGHRHVLHMAGPDIFTTSQVRSAAFTAALGRRRGVTSRVVPAQGESVAAGRATMDMVLASGQPCPTAIVAGNDRLAIGILHSLRAHGLDCPRDVSVIGFDDMPFAEDIQPPLTTVRVPHRELGVEAARVLLRAIQGGEQEPRVVLPVSLIVRGSTAPPVAR